VQSLRLDKKSHAKKASPFLSCLCQRFANLHSATIFLQQLEFIFYWSAAKNVAPPFCAPPAVPLGLICLSPCGAMVEDAASCCLYFIFG